MVRMNVGACWDARIQVIRVVRTFVHLGAVGMLRDVWGLPCATHFVYLSPIRAPATKFFVIVFGCEESERPE